MTAPTPPGAPCWIDLLSSDVERSREFYSRLFGWTAGEPSPEFGGYFMFFADGVPVAGGMPSQPGTATPGQWAVYLAVDDARGTVERAEAHGAKVRAPAMDVADLGCQAIIDDVGGARVGIWQPNTFVGFGERGRAGTPVWFELHTDDYDDAVSFYRDVFGWDAHTMSDTPQFRYTTLGEGEGALAGIMARSEGPGGNDPAAWSVYFGVDDADAALATVVELRGSVRRPAVDTPYGRLASVIDPTGAPFNLMGPSRETPAPDTSA